MSAINKQPFIEQVLATLTSQELSTLKGLINGSDTTPDYISLVPTGSGAQEHILSAEDKGVSYIELNVGGNYAQKIYTGYLLYNDTYCVLLYFSGKKQQNLGMLNINATKHTFEFVNVPLTIVELRSELNDKMATAGLGITVQADDVDSTGIGGGKVLISTAEGGAEWGNGGATIWKHELAISADNPVRLFIVYNTSSNDISGSFTTWLSSNPAACIAVYAYASGGYWSPCAYVVSGGTGPHLAVFNTEGDGITTVNDAVIGLDVKTQI